MNPVISIVTVVYNGDALLERTIRSVIGQTYKNIDYVIVDGNSKDNTREIIRKYEDRLGRWISEPDKGLYDAMNKAIQLAVGDYILFMNAGDELYEPETIEKMIRSTDTSPDIYYGETLLVDENFRPLGTRSEMTPHKLPGQLKWQDMAYGMVVCHQSIIIRKSIIGTFDLSHPYCADIDNIIRALKKAKTVVHTKTIVSKFLKGGLSDKRLRKSLIDRFQVLSTHFGLFRTLISHIFITFRAIGFYKRK